MGADSFFGRFGIGGVELNPDVFPAEVVSNFSGSSTTAERVEDGSADGTSCEDAWSNECFGVFCIVRYLFLAVFRCSGRDGPDVASDAGS